MLTDLNSGGFRLYEILFYNTIVGIKTGLNSVSLFSLPDRFVCLNTAIQFKDILRLMHLLPLNMWEFHRLKSESRELPLQRKNKCSYKTVLQEKVPPCVILSELTALPLEAPSFTKLRITEQKPWSVRLYVSDRLEF